MICTRVCTYVLPTRTVVPSVQHQCTYVVYCRNLALLLRSISFRLRLTCLLLLAPAQATAQYIAN